MNPKFLEFILKSAKHVKRIAYLIAAIGAAASYMTQVELLKVWELGNFAYVIPATIDLLAICAAIGLNIPRLPERDQKYIKRVLTIAVLVSVIANMAGGHNWVARLGHAWPVVAYLLAEGIANRIRNFAAKLEDEIVQPSVPQIETAPAVKSIKKAATPAAIGMGRPGSAKVKILEMAASTPRPTDEEIAEAAGVKVGWVRYVLKKATEEVAA